MCVKYNNGNNANCTQNMFLYMKREKIFQIKRVQQRTIMEIKPKTLNLRLQSMLKKD